MDAARGALLFLLEFLLCSGSALDAASTVASKHASLAEALRQRANSSGTSHSGGMVTWKAQAEAFLGLLQSMGNDDTKDPAQANTTKALVNEIIQLLQNERNRIYADANDTKTEKEKQARDLLTQIQSTEALQNNMTQLQRMSNMLTDCWRSVDESVDKITRYCTGERRQDYPIYTCNGTHSGQSGGNWNTLFGSSLLEQGQNTDWDPKDLSELDCEAMNANKEKNIAIAPGRQFVCNFGEKETPETCATRLEAEINHSKALLAIQENVYKTMKDKCEAHRENRKELCMEGNMSYARRTCQCYARAEDIHQFLCHLNDDVHEFTKKADDLKQLQNSSKALLDNPETEWQSLYKIICMLGEYVDRYPQMYFKDTDIEQCDAAAASQAWVADINTLEDELSEALRVTDFGRAYKEDENYEFTLEGGLAEYFTKGKDEAITFITKTTHKPLWAMWHGERKDVCPTTAMLESSAYNS